MVGLRGNSKHTPFIIFVPILVTKPLTLSDRGDDKTKVEPGSLGARSNAHSWRPSFRERRDSCRERSSHSSSRVYNPFAEELVSSGSDLGEGHVPERWLPPAPAVREAEVGMPRLPSR